MKFTRLEKFFNRIRRNDKPRLLETTVPMPQHASGPVHPPEGILWPSSTPTHAPKPPKKLKRLTRRTKFPPHPVPQPNHDIAAIQFPSTDLVVEDFRRLPSQMVGIREGGVHYPAIMLNYELCSRMQASLRLGREYELLLERNSFRKRRCVFAEQVLLGQLEAKEQEWQRWIDKYGDPETDLAVGKRGFTLELQDEMSMAWSLKYIVEQRLEWVKEKVEEMNEEERELRERIAPSWESWQVLLEDVFEGCGLLEGRNGCGEEYNPAEEEGLTEEAKYPSRIFKDS